MIRWFLTYSVVILIQDPVSNFRFVEHDNADTKGVIKEGGARARRAFYLHKKSLCILDRPRLDKIYLTLSNHHSRDVNYLQTIIAAMSETDPWRCKWCMRLNKAKALRCGRCDYQWHRSHLRTRRQSQTEMGLDLCGLERGRWHQAFVQEVFGIATQLTESPNNQITQKEETESRNCYDSDLRSTMDQQAGWTTPSAPSQSTSTQADASVEAKYNRLVAALEKQENSKEVQQIVEEGSVKVASSKQMHALVKKLDQARDKFHGAQKARQNLHDSWTKYLEESIKRWKTFAEDFGNKDRDLEAKVNQAKDKLQEARHHLNETKEQLSNRDKDFIKDVEIVDSEMDEETNKVETSEPILAGISAMVENLEAVRVRPQEDAMEHTAKKARTESAEVGEPGSVPSGPGARMLQPFPQAGK